MRLIFRCAIIMVSERGENKYMRKRSEKPLGKQQKKNREVLKYEEIKTELTNISPAERRRKRIMVETDVKSASKCVYGSRVFFDCDYDFLDRCTSQ